MSLPAACALRVRKLAVPVIAVAAAEVVKKVRRLGVFGESLVAVDEICSIEFCWTIWSGSKVISKDLFLKRER